MEVTGSSPVSPTICLRAHSSSGLGHRPLKAEITGSNPVCATNVSFQFQFWRTYSMVAWRSGVDWGSCPVDLSSLPQFPSPTTLGESVGRLEYPIKGTKVACDEDYQHYKVWAYGARTK